MVQARLDARLLGEASKLALDRGDQTEVVERRRAQLAGEPKLRAKLRRAGDTGLIFRTEDETAVRRELKRLGLVVPPGE